MAKKKDLNKDQMKKKKALTDNTCIYKSLRKNIYNYNIKTQSP